MIEEVDFTTPLEQIPKDEYPIYRDIHSHKKDPKKKPYEALERYFACLKEGEVIGESCMFGDDSQNIKEKARFYTPIALTDCYYLTLSCESL